VAAAAPIVRRYDFWDTTPEGREVPAGTPAAN